MLDPNVEPSPEPSPIAPPAAAYLPFGAYARPSTLAPARPAWTRTYELPTARRVVNAGLQLALDSNRAVRRASLYVGLLALGAFGPAAILALSLVARFLNIPGAFDALVNHPAQFGVAHPELIGPFAAAELAFGIGIVLLLAISVDAQAIAISLLGSAAAGHPMTLREGLTRARQTFWRLVAAGGLVGIGSGILTFVIAWPFLRANDTNQGIGFIAQVIATLVFMPFAFASTGIVLGDAGAIESLRRSTRLFRARPRIALVVTLFPLVTAAIQSFALDSGASLVERVATFFHLGEGGGPLLVPAILVLGLVMAFGSLTFTIAAIVSAPQVAAFLGLTFYSGGLERARGAAAPDSGRVRWVTVPMDVAMVGIAIVAVLGILALNG